MRTSHRLATSTIRRALLGVVCMSAIACDGMLGLNAITGSGDLTTESYDFTDFVNVDIGHAFEAEITNAETPSVEVTVDDNVVEYLDVKLDGDTLRVRMKGNHSYHNVTMQAAIAMPMLNELKLSGAVKARLGSFDSDEPLKLDLEGASRLDCSDMTSASAVLDLEGASQLDCRDVVTGPVEIMSQGASVITLTGTGGDANVRLEGASQADLSDFPVANADLRLEGASQASVNTDGRLDVRLSGASHVSYSGEPTLGETDMEGASTLDSAG